MLRSAMQAYEAKRFEDAEAALRLVLGRSLNDGYVLYFLGHLAYLQGRLTEALWFLTYAVSFDPDHARSRNDLGETLRALGNNADAVPQLRRAIELDPSLAHAYGNLATALLALDRPEEALRWAQESLRRGADKTVAHCDLGSVFGRLNRPLEALRQYDLALAHRPDNARARYFRGLVRLALGQMPDAWAEHEARFDLPPVVSGSRAFTSPGWLSGTEVADKTVLLHPEQGLGDTIQFTRYVPLVQALGAAVVLEVQPGLAGLCRFPGVTVLETGSDLPPHDLHISLMSLPAIFRTDLTTIPASTPYLAVDAGMSASWASALGPWKRMRVGLAWSGNPSHASDTARSMPLKLLKPLLDRTDIECHVVQRDIREGDDLSAWPGLIDHHADLTDFARTAGLLANMDLVITVDTVIAHLAGALNIPA
ncbi:MAG TPA: tetratricopeptide repeat-containing glycosyltransferase family protein, partial [Rhodopila sp.]|nr:tetratricopeptide repeat-containing glycosyltransferase family protein [Rhodopila sp.]